MGGKLIPVTDSFLYDHRACTPGQMAKSFGCSPEGMADVLRRRQPIRWRTKEGKLCIPASWLLEQARQNRTIHQIQDELHIPSVRTLRRYCDEVGVKLPELKMVKGFSKCPCGVEEECRGSLAKCGVALCEVDSGADPIR